MAGVKAEASAIAIICPVCIIFQQSS